MATNFGPPPEAVTSIIAKEEVWRDSLTIIGSLSPSQGVTLTTEEPGKVVKIGFDSGAVVNLGDTLVKLDTSIEDAQLKAAEAKLKLAELNLQRAQKLQSREAMARSDLDSAQASFLESEAEANALRALIAKKTIVAPFTGRTGIRMVNIGQYLAPGNPIVPLHALNPIFLDFSIPQQNLSQIKVSQKVKFEIDLFPEEIFQGDISAIDPQIDDRTRTLRVQATVINTSEKLRPGMFAKVLLDLGKEFKAITIPASSIMYAPYGNSVYVIESMSDKDNNQYLGVRQKFVTLGQRKGDQIAILKGLEIGEQVVSSGVFKLRGGAAIILNNSIQPGNDPKPNPENT